MTLNRATYLVLGILGLVAILYYRAADTFPSEGQTTLSPGYFPKVLAVALVGLCVASALKTLRTEDKALRIQGLGSVVGTVAGMAIFVAIWQQLGSFYVILFIVSLGLMFFFDPKWSVRRAAVNLAVTSGFVLFVYVLFDNLLNVSFA